MLNYFTSHTKSLIKQVLKTKISNRLLLEVIKPAEDALAADGADREKQCEIISFILRITQENADNLYSLNIQNYAKNIENEVEILYKEHASALSDGMFNFYEQLANWAIYVGLKNNFNPNNIAIEYPKQFEDFTSSVTVEILQSLGNTQQDTSMINMGVQYMSGIYAFHSLFSQFHELRREINNKIPNDINELYEIENASVLKEEEIEEIFYGYLNQECEQYNLEFITDNILHAQTFEYFAVHMPKICHFMNKVSGKHICEEYSLTLISASLHFFASVFHSTSLSFIPKTPLLEASLPLVNSALYNVDLFTNLLKSESAEIQCIINIAKATLSSFITLHQIAGVFLVGNALFRCIIQQSAESPFTKMLAGNMLSLSDDIVTALSPSTTAIQLIAMLLIPIDIYNTYANLQNPQQWTAESDLTNQHEQHYLYTDLEPFDL